MGGPSRIALVTGASRGLGAAIARRLAREGHRVAVLGRDERLVREVADSVGGLPLVADVTDDASRETAVTTLESTWGPPSLVVQNAGIAEGAPLARTTDALWDRIFSVNVTAPFKLARRLVPAMVEGGFGRLVHVASNAGLTGYAYTSAYCASKHALVGFTRALAAELARTGVTVNAVCPGFLATEMTDRTIANIAAKTGRSLADAQKSLEELSPQKRLVSVDEVAHVVAMLCDEASRGVHGQAIAIDGGQVMK